MLAEFIPDAKDSGARPGFAHAPTIAETADGALLCAWFAGSAEGAPDVGIWLARKPRGGAWGRAELVYRDPAKASWNPVLFVDGARIWLWLRVGPCPRTWGGAYLHSGDGGRTWGAIQWLPAGLLGPIRAKPIRLADGAILAGTSVENYAGWAGSVERSDDGGRTWQRCGPLVFPAASQNRQGAIQPSLLETGPGRVRAFLRTRGLGRMATSQSTDGGRTWTPLEPTERPNPNSALDVARLADGRAALVDNPSIDRRSPLVVAVSEDDGETWRDRVTLEPAEHERETQYAYPAVLRGADGRVHVVYSWRLRRIKYVRLEPSDLD